MATSSQPLAQSETKALFLQRLGLDMDRPNDKALYHLMKSEVLAEREHMHSDRSNLLPHIRDDPSHQAPFSYAQMSETALHHATLRIYQNASPVTRQYYDLGQYATTAPQNWVIRWLLWHVFRYRDRRRLKRTTTGTAAQNEDAPPSSRQSPDPSTSQLPSEEDDVVEQSQTLSIRPPQQDAPPTPEPEVPRSTPTPRRPFDPVRDL